MPRQQEDKMKVTKILLIDSDHMFIATVKDFLESTGKYEVYTAKNGTEWLKSFTNHAPDIIISGIEMPPITGLKVINQTKLNNKEIIIFSTTSRSNSSNLVDIDVGENQNDDLSKPYNQSELNSDIQAIFKQISKSTSTKTVPQTRIFIFGEFLLDSKSRYLYRKKEDPLRLTKLENDILLLLLQNTGKIVNREYILDEYWGKKNFYTSRSLDVYIYKLRKYLQSDPSVTIHTIRGEGLEITF